MAVLAEGAAARRPDMARWVQRAVEIPAAVAVLAEVVILLTGVAARYLFDHPLIWSDELASIVFLWLAMLGTAVALGQGQHMRLTFFATRLPPRLAAIAEALAAAAPALFLLLILLPTFDYAQDQAPVETPALGWSGLVRALGMPVGCVLTLAICGARLAQQRLADLLWLAVGLAVIAGALWLGGAALAAMGNWNLVAFFVVLLAAAVFAGVPIAFAFGLATLAYLLDVTDTPLSVVVGRLDEGMSSLILLAVPLFVLLGQLVEMTGMARVMVAFLAALIGHVRGGLAYVLLGAMLLVSGISGSKAADMAAVAPVLFPEMKRRGAEPGEMLALLAASGAMSETIPPSIVLIAIGSVTGVSIAALFTAGMLPGVVIALVLAVVAWARAGTAAEVPQPRAPLREVGRSFAVAIPALVLPFVIRGAVVRGIATATEVSTIGIAYALVVGLLVYRRFDWRLVWPMLVQTASLSGAILLIVGAASAMSWALTQSGFSQALAQAMAAVPGGRWGFLAVSILAFIVLGSVLEGIPAMVLFGPLLFPVAKLAGLNEVHYAVVAVLAMGVGLFAPPVGLGYYAACIIGDVPPDRGLRRIWPYLGAVVLGLLLVAAIPWIATGFL